MKREEFAKKSRAMKLGYIAYQTIRIAVLACLAYELYLRATTGRPTSNLLLYFFPLTLPARIYHMIEERNARKADAKALREYDKMLLHSVLWGIGLLVLLFVGIVLYAATRAISQ